MPAPKSAGCPSEVSVHATLAGLPLRIVLPANLASSKRSNAGGLFCYYNFKSASLVGPLAPQPPSLRPTPSRPTTLPFDIGQPKEVRDILMGKQYIERNTEVLDNPFFDLVPVLGQWHQPHRWMAPVDPKKMKQVELYGYHAVVLKAGRKDLAATVPKYVVFQEPISPALLKSENYETLWVDQKEPKCSNDPKAPMFGSAAAPSCKISTLVRAFCTAARARAFLIRVKGGTYIDSGNMSLCNKMILTNYDNETVRISTLEDIKDGTTDGKWQLVDKANNVWAVNWKSNVSVERWNGVIALTIDVEGIYETPHWNADTVAPELRANTKTFQSDLTKPIFHWMTTVKYIPGNEAVYKSRVAGLVKQNLLPTFPQSICKNAEPQSAGFIGNVMPTYEMMYGAGAPGPLHTKFNGLNPKTCDVVPGHEGQAADQRDVCHWTTPHAKVQGAACETNYLYLSRNDLNQTFWKPEVCNKLLGNPDRCLILRLPQGKSPSSYGRIQASNTAATWYGAWQDSDFTHRNILLRGLLFENYSGFFNGSHAWNNNPARTPLGPSDRYFFRMDGNEIRASKGPGFYPAEGIYVENNYFNGSPFFRLYSGDLVSKKIILRNNFFHASDAMNVVIEDWIDFTHPEKYPSEPCALDKRIEYNTYYQTNIMNSGHMVGWCVENNYVYRGGGQEVIETGHLIHTRFAQNWIEDSAHTGFGPAASGNTPDHIIFNTKVEHNQYIKLMGRGQQGKIPFGTCAKMAGFPWGHYLYGKCDTFTFQNNLFAEANGGGCVQALTTSFCSNATVRNNTFAATKDPAVGGLYFSAFANRTKNFLVRDNLFVGSDDKHAALMFWPNAGESLKDCKARFKSERDRCGTIDVNQRAKCLGTAVQGEAERCSADLDARVSALFLSPKTPQYTFENNFFGTCSDTSKKGGFCPEGAGGFSARNKPQFRNPDAYDFRVLNAKAEDVGGGFKHIGVHYLEELSPAEAPKLPASATRWDIEVLFDQVKASRGEK